MENETDSALDPTNLWIIFRNELMPIKKVMKIIWNEDKECEE